LDLAENNLVVHILGKNLSTHVRNWGQSAERHQSSAVVSGKLWDKAIETVDAPIIESPVGDFYHVIYDLMV